MAFIKHTEVLSYLNTCTDEQLQDLNFLEDFMKTKIGINLNKKALGIPVEYYKFLGNLKAKQYPNEFAQYLQWIYNLCKETEINNYMCIGPERGGEFYTVDSFLRRLNPNFTNSVAYDNHDNMYKFDQYKAIHSAEFVVADSQKMTWDDVPFETVDLCFIDGDHSYIGVKHDFEMVKDHCKYIVLHDIHLTINPTRIQVNKFWDEIKTEYPHWEFSNKDPLLKIPVGIGVLKIK
jgi:hypothetical protein